MKEDINRRATSSHSNTERTSEQATERPVLLVIDDELGPRESLRILFKETYEVVLATCGGEGLETLQKRDVDIIILDLKMPDRGGLETLEDIRKIDESVPVIILTGYGDMAAAKKAIRFGAIEFMSKPFDIKELTGIVAGGIAKHRRKKEADKLLQELDHFNKDLKVRIEKTDGMAAIGQMSAEIIHDVNNLLAVIYGYTQLLVSDIEENSLDINSKYVRTIESEIQRCRNLTKSVIDLTKTPKMTDEININGIVSDIINFLGNTQKGEDITFETILEDNIPFIMGDKNHLHQAIFNIVINSVEALEDKRTISFETTSKGSEVALRIKDRGKGIPEEEMSRICKPLFSLDYKKGAGLGLSITKRIVEKHGGRLEIKNRQNGGVETSIFLPASSFKTR